MLEVILGNVFSYICSHQQSQIQFLRHFKIKMADILSFTTFADGFIGSVEVETNSVKAIQVIQNSHSNKSAYLPRDDFEELWY